MLKILSFLCVVYALLLSDVYAQEGAAPAQEPVFEAAVQPEGSPALCAPLMDEAGAPRRGEDGAIVYDLKDGALLDAQGAPLLAADGTALIVPCEIPQSEALDIDEEAFREAVTQEKPLTGWAAVQAFMETGGPVIVILMILAAMALALVLVKLIQFLAAGVGRRSFAHVIINRARTLGARDALEEAERRRSPVARVMAAALRGRIDPKMNDQKVREETTRIAQANLDGLERGLAILGLIAAISPLLGLLGTVLGMIEAFQQMQSAGDRVSPGLLAGGIWEALLTTAAGLTVAIPAAVFSTLFQRTLDGETSRMEDAVTQVFTLDLYNDETAEAEEEV